MMARALIVWVLCSILTYGSTTSAAQQTRANTWTARTSAGRTFMGTWTATPDATAGSVTGTWTLDDPTGRTAARGTWSANKSRTAWTGAWRAIVAPTNLEYAGSWSAVVDLKGDAQFADLFQKAAHAVVRGNWRAGRQSGSWAIRVSASDKLPEGHPENTRNRAKN